MKPFSQKDLKSSMTCAKVLIIKIKIYIHVKTAFKMLKSELILC